MILSDKVPYSVRHRHWIINIDLIILAILAGILFLLISEIVLAVLVTLSVFTYFYLKRIDNLIILYKDSILITKDKLININQKEIYLNEITDISCKRDFFGKLLNYGTIEIQTKNNKEIIKFVSDPEGFCERVFYLKDYYDKE